MQLYQTLSALIDDNWSVFDDKKMFFHLKKGDLNTVDISETKINLVLKPWYYNAIVKKYLSPISPKEFYLLVINIGDKIEVIPYVNGDRKKTTRVPNKPPNHTFLTVVSSIASCNWVQIPKTVITVESRREYWNPETNTLGMFRGSDAQKLVFDAVGESKNFKLSVADAETEGGLDSNLPHLPKLVLYYHANLNGRKGKLRSGIAIETTTEVAPNCVTNTTVVSHKDNVLHKFTKTARSVKTKKPTNATKVEYKIDDIEASCEQVSRISGEMLLKQWVVE
jgi:hypothetical protein